MLDVLMIFVALALVVAGWWWLDSRAILKQDRRTAIRKTIEDTKDYE